jgi:hypothetical protein
LPQPLHLQTHIHIPPYYSFPVFPCTLFSASPLLQVAP